MINNMQKVNILNFIYFKNFNENFNFKHKRKLKLIRLLKINYFDDF